MGYTIPVCDCGTALDVVTSTMHTNTFKILKNGQQAKTKKCPSNTENWMVDLHCESCGNIYELKDDEKGRIIRGAQKEN